MLKLYNANRCQPKSLLKVLVTCSREFSDDDKKKKAAQKLQELLAKLAAESVQSNEKEMKEAVKVSLPQKKFNSKRPVERIKLEKISDKHTVHLVNAVKDVADHIGGTSADVKVTEAELLHVILNNKRPDGKEVKDLKLSNVISNMQVEKTAKSRAEQVRRSFGQERKQRTVKRETTYAERPKASLDLFNGTPLGIFQRDMSAATDTFELLTWRNLTEKDLKLKVTHPPSNIYEEMIRWTDRRQLWQFPIDNEQGMEEEKAFDFTQHVFLEEHLEPWCPSKGPVKQFMDLVLIGLSKNPHLTVKAKIEHIHWFRDYFEGKRKLLVETGSLPDESRPDQLPAS